MSHVQRIGTRRSRRARLLPIIAVAALTGLAACQRTPQAAPVVIAIEHRAGDAPLQLGRPFATSGGEELTVDKLRYYLSNLRLRRADGSWYVNPQSPQTPAGYFLVDEAVPESKRLEIGPVPPGDYRGIEFLIGIDETRNHSGAQTGPLDPARGMFWMWHSGYVFLKLEGRSPQSTAQAQTVSYHVGGGDIEAPLARTVFLSLPEPLRVAGPAASELRLTADLASLFAGPAPLRVSTLAEAMEPPAVVPVADAFAASFQVRPR